jgi:hypothetical protein
MSDKADTMPLGLADIVRKRQIAIRREAHWSKALKPSLLFRITQWCRNFLEDGLQFRTIYCGAAAFQNANPPVNPVLAFDTGLESQCPYSWVLSKSPDIGFLTCDASAIDARLLAGSDANRLPI